MISQRGTTVRTTVLLALCLILALIFSACGMTSSPPSQGESEGTRTEEARNLPKFGYQRQLNAEGILSLRPSAIAGTEEAGPPEVIEQLRSSGALAPG